MLRIPSRARHAQTTFSHLLALIAAAALLLGACGAPIANVGAATEAPLASVANGAPAPLPPRQGGAFPTPTLPEGDRPVAETPADTGVSTAGQDESAPAEAILSDAVESGSVESSATGGEAFTPAEQPTPLLLPTPTPNADTAATAAAAPADWAVRAPVQVALADALPPATAQALRTAIAAIDSLEGDNGAQPVSLAADAGDASTRVDITAGEAPGHALQTRYFAPVVPFDTLQDDITLDELAARWQGSAPVFTTDVAMEWLPALLGSPASSTEAVAPDTLIALLEENRDAIAIIPFEQIDPRFKVLAVDGVNVLSNTLQVDAYPLVAQVKISGEGAAQIYARLAAVAPPTTNRHPGKLTTLVMTGVTAMARGTAAAIERVGDPAYPPQVIGPELALADITHVSNEIPFIEGCVVNNTENNLQLCSDPSYWAALELMGTDIVGLSGNHVNDFGRDGARESLGWYKENKIPVYGSGLTVDAACAPLLWASNGNTFAFIAALAYGPESAWVTDEEPGSCYYYEHKDRIISTIETLSKAVDIVAVELQYEETYFPWPTPTQVEEFRELRAAGADLVTGVQSHVPQAQEPYGAFDVGGDGFISYGLGNLYFDQMWSWETRTELYARHAIYDGKLINTEILTGVLEDYAQPRWATPEERADLLQTIFDGAPARP